jgi:hypothetical protein
VKYLNVILTIVAVLLGLNLFKDSPAPAYADQMSGELDIALGNGGLSGMNGPLKIEIEHTHFFQNNIN